MSDWQYIWDRIIIRFLSAHWLLILALLFYVTWLADHGHIVGGTMGFAALLYFLSQTWPQRWALDIVILWGLTSFIWQTLAMGLTRWQLL